MVPRVRARGACRSEGSGQTPGRSATAANPDWGLVATDAALLAALLAVCATLATRAFRSYQRSV